MISDAINDAVVSTIPASAIPTSAPASDVVQYYGQIGDFVGGVWGTIIGLITLIIVAATWYTTQKINEKAKKYQIFSEILRSHEEIVTSIRLDGLSGRDAFGSILAEFYAAYSAILEVSKNTGRTILLEKRIDVAFTIVYYGAHPETIKLLNKTNIAFDNYAVGAILSNKKKSNSRNRIAGYISQQLEGDPIEKHLWQKLLLDAIQIANTAPISTEDRNLLRSALTTARHLPRKRINRDKLTTLIEEYQQSTEFGGHQNRLSNYFRNLFSAFVFIDESGLSKKEKRTLAKVLRAKLSNYEQALLALNAISEQGSEWIKSGLMREYAPIKNIPKHFFVFDSEFNLKEAFDGVIFEWEK